MYHVASQAHHMFLNTRYALSGLRYMAVWAPAGLARVTETPGGRYIMAAAKGEHTCMFRNVIAVPFLTARCIQRQQCTSYSEQNDSRTASGAEPLRHITLMVSHVHKLLYCRHVAGQEWRSLRCDAARAVDPSTRSQDMHRHAGDRSYKSMCSQDTSLAPEPPLSRRCKSRSQACRLFV